MSDSQKKLPSWWAEGTFDLLFRNVTSSSLKIQQKLYKRFGKYPVIDQGQNLIGGYTDDEKLLHPNMPPLIVFGDHTRCLKFVDFRFSQGADGVKVLEPNISMDPWYCFWALKHTSLPDKGYSRHFKFLKNSVLPIPPFNEQKRIVTRIKELQARSRRASEALEAIPDLLDQLRQSILAAAFRGDLTKEWRKKTNSNIEPATELLKRIRAERRKHWEEAELERLKARNLTGEKLKEAFAACRKQYKEPTPVDTKNLPELPEGWCWASLLQISEVIDPNPKHRNPQYNDNGFPFVSTMDFARHDSINLNTSRRVSETVVVEQENRFTYSDRTILFSRKGTIGTTRIMPKGIRIALLDSLVTIAPCHLIDHFFLNNALRSYFVQAQVENLTRGVALKQVSVGAVRSLVIPIAPSDEQKLVRDLLQKITNHFFKFEDVVKELTQKCESLDQSIITKAFRGELVMQDQNDEPASILLERIRQEKASATIERKAKVKRKGKKMKHKPEEHKNVLTVLSKSGHALTPEEVFTASGFDEASVDIFYEQLRAAIDSKKIREIKKGKTVRLEAVTP